VVAVFGSGDGWVTVADGTRRWGRYGAAGVLARNLDDDGSPWYFLARRSEFCHRGGTWAIPGGAINAGEAPLDAAVREFTEEIGPLLAAYDLASVHEDDHGGWSYWTHVVDVPHRFDPPVELSWETAEARWVHAGELHQFELFDAFADTLERIGLLPLRDIPGV
jgi:8-oxo-dGTP diphosphatase